MYAFPMYFNVIISYSFTTAIPLPLSPQNAEKTWTTNLSPAILNILPHLFLTSTHRCPRFNPARLVILV